MSTAERREREKEQRRITIMDAAEHLIFANGADNTSMDEIADQAELSKGLLYFYFKSKEDLMHSIVHRGLSILAGFFRQALEDHELGIDQARAVGEAYIRFSEEHPKYFGLMSWFETERTPDPAPGTYSHECETEGENVLGLVAQSIVNGIVDGTIRSDLDPKETAIMLWGMTHGIITMAGYKQHGHQPRLDPSLLLNGTLDFISRWLAPAEKREKLLS
jgi:AcrR family transcriptional regulator